MKKIYATLLATILLLLAFTGCTAANAPSVKALIAAVEKTQALGEVDATLDMNLSMGSGEEFMEMPATGTIKYVQKDDDFTMESMLEIAIAEQAMQVQSYYTQGNLYTAVGENKMKMSAAVDAAVNAGYAMIDLSEDMVKSFETEQTEGGVAYKLIMNDEKVSDYLTQLINQSGVGSLGVESMSYKFSNLSLQYVVDKDGYAAQQHIAFDCAATISMAESQAMEMQMKMDTTVQYQNIGQPVTITLPTDLDTYQEITEEPQAAADAAA